MDNGTHLGPSTLARLGAPALTRLLGVGSATPPCSYSQKELLDLFGFQDPITRRVFETPHITKRHLILPERDPHTGRLPREPARALIEKFQRGALEMGKKAIYAAIDDSGFGVGDIDAIICVTSTGFMVPGLSCLFVRELGLRTSCRRIDIVGMGCNAGLNGLASLDGWSRQHPGQLGLLVCCEVNSAIYCHDDTSRDGIVNSLFADGAAAIVVRADPAEAGNPPWPSIIDFESHMIPEEWGAMRFDWHDELACWRFYLSRNIPYLLGVHCANPVINLLKRNGVRRRDIDHWIIHTGGGAVIDAIKLKLGLSEHDVRHTRSVLRDFGNLSSGSFLFSYQRLLREGAAAPGEYGIMMTMGPGAQIETALLRW
jgi:3,5-dihydroxyphenylacetyl-CoA synthase